MVSVNVASANVMAVGMVMIVPVKISHARVLVKLMVMVSAVHPLLWIAKNASTQPTVANAYATLDTVTLISRFKTAVAACFLVLMIAISITIKVIVRVAFALV
jgi:hypothetical protein